MSALNDRIKALEKNVQELSHVVLSTGGTERAWQIAALALLQTTTASPEACKVLSQRLEETRSRMVSDGAARVHVEAFCMAARLILGTAYGSDQKPSATSEVH